MLEARTDTYGWAKERLLRVLLDPESGILAGNSLYRIAKTAHVSYPWAYDIWRDLLAQKAFLTPRGKRHATDPRYASVGSIKNAFRYWLDHRPSRVYADYHVMGALDLLKSLEDRPDLEYAATTYLAENLLQGHLFPRRFDIYIRKSQANSWSAELKRHGFPIDTEHEGRGTIRLTMAEDAMLDEAGPMHPDPFPPEKPIRGIRIVRTPLLIVDLLEEGGSCAEAAEMLMEKTYGTTIHRS